jgi:hypothetical protein
VKVFFQKDLYPQIIANKTVLVLKEDPESTCRIKYDLYKKFQVRDIFVKGQLVKHRFTGIKIGKTILKHYETLDKVKL